MRRIATNPLKRADQARLCANGIDGEPAWPASAPTAAQLRAAADLALQRRSEIVAAEQALITARFRDREAQEELLRLIRSVDGHTTALYGFDSPIKGRFGVRAFDTTRNSLGPVPQVEKVRLLDGPDPGSLIMKWKPVTRATYHLEWCSDEACTQILGHASSTRAEFLIPALEPGTRIWARVRALRWRRQGDWSEPASRIANV